MLPLFIKFNKDVTETPAAVYRGQTNCLVSEEVLSFLEYINGDAVGEKFYSSVHEKHSGVSDGLASSFIRETYKRIYFGE